MTSTPEQYVEAARNRAAFIIPELTTTLQKQDQTRPHTGGGSAPSGSTPAANLTAIEVKAELLRAQQEVDIRLAAGLPYTTIVDRAEQLHYWTDKAWELVDLPPEREKIGNCPACDDPQFVNKGDEPELLECGRCGAWNQTQPMRGKYRAELHDAQNIEGTPSQLAAYAKAAGLELKPARIWKWVQRGKLSPAGTTRDVKGEVRVTYRFADVRALVGK